MHLFYKLHLWIWILKYSTYCNFFHILFLLTDKLVSWYKAYITVIPYISPPLQTPKWNNPSGVMFRKDRSSWLTISLCHSSNQTKHNTKRSLHTFTFIHLWQSDALVMIPNANLCPPLCPQSLESTRRMLQLVEEVRERLPVFTLPVLHVCVRAKVMWKPVPVVGWEQMMTWVEHKVFVLTYQSTRWHPLGHTSSSSSIQFTLLNPKEIQVNRNLDQLRRDSANLDKVSWQSCWWQSERRGGREGVEKRRRG